MTLARRDETTEVGLTKAGLDHTRDQLKLLEDFVKDVLRKDEDYGVIPGAKKPSLLKPGAANVAAAFNCHAEPAIDTAELDREDGFVSYEAHVDLVSNLTGMVMARGFGNCNSQEVKYRYRWEGEGENRQRVENPDPLEQANTIKKMAIKRAEVDAAMRLPGVARFFTQDLEDMQSNVGEPETPKDNRYHCTEHNTEWFKRGKMKNYAHPPTGPEGSPWCYMKDAPISTAAERSDQAILSEPTRDGAESTRLAPPATEGAEGVATPQGPGIEGPTAFWEAVRKAGWTSEQAHKACDGSVIKWITAEPGRTWGNAWAHLERTRGTKE